MSIKRSFFPLLSFILFLLPISISAYQNEVTNSLATPQKAVHTFLHWQQTGHTDLVKAASTMKIHDGSLDERI
ncbi:MAG TPA: mechanosensitive ion channel family protein, partial [Balneola sp.]|nr:mechanosensitive ion channel family protein [Balneola sp.]